MSGWSNRIELREENGIINAYNDDEKQVAIRECPGSDADDEWFITWSFDELEAARQYYLDKWTWDEDLAEYKSFAETLETIINKLLHECSLTVGYRGVGIVDASVFYCPYIPIQSA
jgi:hypothetical protein